MVAQYKRGRSCLFLSICTLSIAVLPFWMGCADREQVVDGRTVITGTVAFDGQPLPGGTISFTSQSDPALRIATKIRSAGKFATDRAPIGASWVTIDTSSMKYGNPAAFVTIPEKYRDPGASGLSVDLQPGKNQHVEFALEK